MSQPRYLSPRMAEAIDALPAKRITALSVVAQAVVDPHLRALLVALAEEANMAHIIRQMEYADLVHRIESEQAAEADAIAQRLIDQGKLTLPQRTEGTPWWPMGGEPE